MTETVDDLSIEYSENGQLLVKQLDKEVLTKGAWSTIMYRYQDWDKRNEEYGKEKYTIRRYQKRNGEYKLKSKFNISSADQALGVIEILQKWITDGENNVGKDSQQK
ncbi:MAG TPA: hypothetical protein ENI80_05925 [Acidiferrobacteraceae bacterium]|nr:hypothetical protein [Acidiferrobacteraceae bacterium]